MSQTETLREQRYARAVDREVAPVWHDRFAEMIWRNLPRERDALVLDVHSGPGRTTAELLDRLPGESRIVSLEPSSAMRALAKARVPPDVKKRVYLKPGDMTDVADMADDTYDLVVANLVLSEAHDADSALQALIRVTKPGGHVFATFPMDSTWREAEDLLREVLRDAELLPAVRRLRRLANLRPTGPEVARIVRELGATQEHFVIEQDSYNLLFQSGREFLFSPLVEFGPLRLWKAIIGDDGKPQELFWRLKEAIDSYFAGHVFSVTVNAGLLALTVPNPDGDDETATLRAAEYWAQYPHLDALWRTRELADASDLNVDEVDIEIELDEPGDVDEASTDEHPTSTLPMADDDEAIFAQLEKPSSTEPAAELDALLDQVLEFAGPLESKTHELDELDELDEADLEEIKPDLSPRKPMDTLERIKALLPPPPVVPPPPRKKDDK